MKVTLYSTSCPKCFVLKSILNKSNITYNEINDIEIMLSKNFMSAPILEVDNKILDYKQAIQWVKERNGN